MLSSPVSVLRAVIISSEISEKLQTLITIIDLSKAKPEWPTGLQCHAWCVLHGKSWVWASSKPPPILVDMSVHSWIKKTRLPCWPLYSQQVSHQKWTWGSHKQESTQNIHPSFETQGRSHQKSKTWVSVAPRKRLVSSKKFKRIGGLFKPALGCKWKIMNVKFLKYQRTEILPGQIT